MPAARALSGTLADWFGRHETFGHDLVKHGQAAGLFPVGAGGAAGALPATSRDAVFLFLALSSGLGPKAALRQAALLFGLPFLARGLLTRRYPEDAKRTDLPPAGINSFGHHLAHIVSERRRLGEPCERR